MSQDEQKLKQYEREILRARSRVQVAELDTEIDKQIDILLGKLSRTQHKQYQARKCHAGSTGKTDQETGR